MVVRTICKQNLDINIKGPNKIQLVGTKFLGIQVCTILDKIKKQRYYKRGV